MSWGTKRRNLIIFLVIIVLVIPVIVGLFLLFYNPPTCFDGSKNGDETGVDCGGSCELLCTIDTLPPTIVWERYFKVTDGVYNVIAYVENQNPAAGVIEAPYEFQLFNREGVPIVERTGVARLKPKSVVPIIEVNLSTAQQLPTRVSFEFTEDLVFVNEEPDPVVMIIKDEQYFVDNVPKVTASIQNITLETLEDIQVIVLLYDVFDNVVGTSSTFVEKINPEGSRDITFTWPNNFNEEVSRIEIVPIYEPNF